MDYDRVVKTPMQIEHGVNYLIAHSDPHGDWLYNKMLSPDITYVAYHSINRHVHDEWLAQSLSQVTLFGHANLVYDT